MLENQNQNKLCDFVSASGVSEVIPETIGQYTGLKDKNGIKIHESDIITDYYKTEATVIYSDKDVASCGCCIPEFTGIGFVAEMFIKDHNRARLDNESEVIGNIHDNKELLEKESN